MSVQIRKGVPAKGGHIRKDMEVNVREEDRKMKGRKCFLEFINLKN